MLRPAAAKGRCKPDIRRFRCLSSHSQMLFFTLRVALSAAPALGDGSSSDGLKLNS
jgi:hypothetical protein